MRHAIGLAATLALLAVLAPPALASDSGPLYTWRYAELYYASEAVPSSSPGIHSQLTIRISQSETRDGATSTVQVISTGWSTSAGGGMDYDWYAAYEIVGPYDPSLGGVDPSLRSAWISTGPIELACYQGQCPALPAQLSVSGTWTATGPASATTEKVIDDLGWSSNLMRRERPASSDVVLSPALDRPAVLIRSVIASQSQVSIPLR